MAKKGKTCIAIRLIGFAIAFFMVTAVDMTAQINSSSGSSFSGKGSESSVFIPASISSSVNPVEKSGNVVPDIMTQHIQTRGESSILKITHDGSDIEFTSWAKAMEALQEGDEITLLQDVTLGEDEKMPLTPCIINGGDSQYTLAFNQGGIGNCNLQAAVTFKNIELSANLIMANGHPVIFDKASTGSGFVFGGGKTEAASTSITIKEGAELGSVYGGGFTGKVTGNTQVTVEGGTVLTIFAGGYEAPVEGTANLTISGGTIGNETSIYGGGQNKTATCGNTNVILSGGTINAWVFGGGSNGAVLGTAKVSLQGSTIHKNLYGGGQNNSGTCKNTEVTVSNGSVIWLFGGGEKAPVTETAKLTISGGTINRTACGGAAVAEAFCKKTDVLVSGGTINEYLCGGGEMGGVDDANLTISGGNVNWDTFGGSFGFYYDGVSTPAEICGKTNVNISGGTLGYINGGSRNGSVTGECHLSISGTPVIKGNVFGGCNFEGTTTGSTHVEISGGTFRDPDNKTLNGSIFAGGWGCTVTGNTSLVATGGTIGTLFGGCCIGAVTGSTYVEVNGATMDGGTYKEQDAQGSVVQNPGIIYGAGRGIASSTEHGNVGSTKVVVKNLSESSKKVDVFGGGAYGSVVRNTEVIIENGNIEYVCGSSSSGDDEHLGTVGGDVNILVKGGEIQTIGAARDQNKNQAFPVTGEMNIVIEGGEVTRGIFSGNSPYRKDYKSSTLTIRNLGRNEDPYRLPEVYAITNLILDNSVITYREPQKIQDVGIFRHSIVINPDYPMTIGGSGKVIGGPIILENFRPGSPKFPENVSLLVGDNLSEARFVSYEGVNPNNQMDIFTLPVYKAGNTYRRTAGEDKVKTVTIKPSDEGKPSVGWEKTNLESGDKVPVGADLTLSVVPNAGYEGGTIFVNDQPSTGSTYKVTGDVTFSVKEFIAIPYTVTVAPVTHGRIVAAPDKDITVGTTVSLSVTPDKGCRLVSGSLKVYKSDEEAKTVAVSGHSFTMPAYHVTVTGEFERIPTPPTPPAPVYYTVSVPAIEGVTTDPKAGDYEVESWDNFRFYLTLDKEYDQSKPVVTTDRGETLSPRASDGAYTVKYVRSDVAISIDGIVKNPAPVANAAIQTGVKVWVNDHRLYLRTGNPGDVFIYTFNGELRKTFRSQGGDEAVALSPGCYIICVHGKRFKVVL